MFSPIGDAVTGYATSDTSKALADHRLALRLQRLGALGVEGVRSHAAANAFAVGDVAVLAMQLLIARTDAARTAYSVGYESASQFSREYARMFGASPMRDGERLRGEASEIADAA